MFSAGSHGLTYLLQEAQGYFMLDGITFYHIDIPLVLLLISKKLWKVFKSPNLTWWNRVSDPALPVSLHLLQLRSWSFLIWMAWWPHFLQVKRFDNCNLFRHFLDAKSHWKLLLNSVISGPLIISIIWHFWAG
jgi:hypothetical protein